MIGLPGAHNESHEGFAWQHSDLLTKGKHTAVVIQGVMSCPGIYSDWFFPCGLVFFKAHGKMTVQEQNCVCLFLEMFLIDYIFNSRYSQHQ